MPPELSSKRSLRDNEALNQNNIMNNAGNGQDDSTLRKWTSPPILMNLDPPRPEYSDTDTDNSSEPDEFSSSSWCSRSIIVK